MTKSSFSFEAGFILFFSVGEKLLEVLFCLKMWSNFLCVYSAMNMVLQSGNMVSATKNLHIVLSSTFIAFMCVFCKRCSIQNINTTIMDKYVALSW